MVLSLKRQLSRNDILFEFNNIRSLGRQLMISSEQLALANSNILKAIALTVTYPRHLKVSLTCKLMITYALNSSAVTGEEQGVRYSPLSLIQNPSPIFGVCFYLQVFYILR